MSLQPCDHLGTGDGSSDRDRRRLDHRRGGQDAGPSGHHRQPGHDGRDAHGHQPDREVPTASPALRPSRRRMKANAIEADPRRLPHLCHRSHRDEGERDACQRTEHGGPRHPCWRMHRSEQRTDADDDADDERPGQARAPRLERGRCWHQGGQHDDEHHEEDVRHAGPYGRAVTSVRPPWRASRRASTAYQMLPSGSAMPSAGRIRPYTVPAGSSRRTDTGRSAPDVQQDIRAQPEAAVPVTLGPPLGPMMLALPRSAVAGRSHGDSPLVDRSCSRAAESAPTQPTMPPWAENIARADSWNSRKVRAGAVAEDQAVEAPVVGLPGGRLHAHLGGHPGQHEVGDALGPEDGFQVGGVEGPLPGLSITTSPATGASSGMMACPAEPWASSRPIGPSSPIRRLGWPRSRLAGNRSIRSGR